MKGKREICSSELTSVDDLDTELTSVDDQTTLQAFPGKIRFIFCLCPEKTDEV